MDTDAINMMSGFEPLLMKDRFRGFLPVVVDIETGGFNCHTDGTFGSSHHITDHE